jgi:hypothetical protein
MFFISNVIDDRVVVVCACEALEQAVKMIPVKTKSLFIIAAFSKRLAEDNHL